MPLRLLVALIVFALSASAEAQQPRNIPRIGFLSQVPVAGPNNEAFRQGLREHGYVDGKTMEVVKEIFPKLVRVAILPSPGGRRLELKEMQAAALSLQIQLHILDVRVAQDLEGAFKEAAKDVQVPSP